MNFLFLFDKFQNFFKLLESPRFRTLYRSETVNTEDIESNVIYIISSGGFKKWIQFRCPCGCGEVILLNLSNSRRPVWKVYKNLWGRVSIFPSVWRTEGCKSHFFVRDGRIDWCPEASSLNWIRKNS